jgi:hypothetical protein
LSAATEMEEDPKLSRAKSVVNKRRSDSFGLSQWD